LALVPALGFVCIAASLTPNGVLSESVDSKPGTRVTLLVRTKTRVSDNWEKATVLLRPEDPHDLPREPGNEWDLLYGALNYNGDRDWFQVNCDKQSRSRIRDLGELAWTDEIKVPVLPILPCPADQPCGRIRIPSRESEKNIHDEDVNPHVAKPVAGHMYVVHRHRERNRSESIITGVLLDYYALVRVEELKPNESCTITWKRISAPKK